MARYLFSRLMLAIAVALTLSIATFLLLNAAVDPAAAIAGVEATDEQIEAVRRQLGLDRPLHIQYLDWLGGILTGDFGTSWYWREPVATLIARHLPITIQLALMAVFVTVIVALPLGVAAALRPNSWVDRLATSFAVANQAVPNFWLGLVFIMVFALQLKWFPVSGDTTFLHFIMPAVVLGLSSVPAVMRLTRTGLLDALGSDYVRTARSKGVPAIRIVWVHAMRNAILPVVAVLAIQLGSKLGGSVVTESVFAINGLGRLAIQSILAADVPTVQMLVFTFAMFFIVLNLLADLINVQLNPRLRIG